MAPQDLSKFKLFPRNLTAKADTLVRGNPVVSRPEDGVENCFPGLELDQRNLDKVFFPGLTFELHHSMGVVLREFDPNGPAAQFFNHDDLQHGVFLVFLQGTFSDRRPGTAPRVQITRFVPPAGLESWRVIRDLEEGQIAVALCGKTVFDRLIQDEIDISSADRWLVDRTNRSIIVPAVGKVVVLFGDRARYLTPDGVIKGDLIKPGDLTRSLCSPWQYDFADCGCFYWAANKPDLVASDHQPKQILNFQRRDRSPEADALTKADDWVLRYGRNWEDRDSHILRHSEMIERWSELPFVIDGRETKHYQPPNIAPLAVPLRKAEIILRLKKLAAVEHALAVQYLYAFYSLAPRSDRPNLTAEQSERVEGAANQIFRVAIDEMRHLRLVNEILINLGEPWVLSRATIIGEDFNGDGRAFKTPFSLTPLTTEQLDWFIKVEQQSQNAHDTDTTIDGMYTHILRSVAVSSEFSPAEKARVSHFIKVIIDEGINHYEMFIEARRLLGSISPAAYLGVTTNAPALLPLESSDRILQDTVNLSYAVVLRSLDYVFQLGDAQRGTMVEAARRAMYNMDDACVSLSHRGVAATFDMGAYQNDKPAGLDLSGALDRRSSMIDRAKNVGSPMIPQLGMLEASPDSALRELGRRSRRRLEQMTSAFVEAARSIRE